mgnify:FL=1|jgi:hypothetical protein|tara:strand:+ start:242 stop:355 length:114 start_codon:yes stop_codon:yes gene_type:complete
MNISADAVEYVVVHTEQGDIVVRVDAGIVEDEEVSNL